MTVNHDRAHPLAHAFFLTPIVACFLIALYDFRALCFFAGLGSFLLMFYIVLVIGGRQRRRARREGWDLP